MTSLFHHPTGARMLSAIALALLASCGGGGDDSGGGPPAPSAAPVVYTTPLSGAQEVPPTASSATATGTLTLDPATRTFSATVGTSGITGTMAHIHQGAIGVNGPIIFPLTESAPGSGNWSASGTLSEAQLGLLNAGNYYFNVHSAALPNGEIRGQINPASAAPTPAPAPMPETDGDGY